MLAALVPVADLPAWVLAGVAMFAAWHLSRGGGGGALHELSEANRVLERRVHELGAEVRDLRIENAELNARTDIEAVVQRHELRAEQRHDATLKVLELIARRLGPDVDRT